MRAEDCALCTMLKGAVCHKRQTFAIMRNFLIDRKNDYIVFKIVGKEQPTNDF